jgi:hypothetical protein
MIMSFEILPSPHVQSTSLIVYARHVCEYPAIGEKEKSRVCRNLLGFGTICLKVPNSDSDHQRLHLSTGL